MTVEEQVPSTAKSELANLSVKDLFYKYVRFLPLFIICISLALFVSYLYLRYATLVYSASGTLVIKDEKSGGGGGNDKLEQLMASDGKKNILNEIEYLKSRPLMERVVRNLNLNFTYIAKGNIKELNVYKSCPFRVEAFKINDSLSTMTMNFQFKDQSSFYINGEARAFKFGEVFKNTWGVFRVVRVSSNAVGNEYIVRWQPTHVVAGALSTDLVVAPKNQGTGILNIIKETTNPDLAADVINRLMEEYKLAVIEDKNDATQKAIAFIDSRLAVVQHELDSINNAIYAYMRANNLVDPEVQSSNFMGRIEEAFRASSEQRLQLNNAELIDAYLQDRRTASEPVPSTLGINDPTLNELIQGYNKSQIERKALLENAPAGNVAVQQKSEEVELLRKKVLENLRNIKRSYSNAIANAQGQSNSAESQVRTLPGKMQVLGDMKLNQQGKQVIKNSLLQKREESAIALASTISNTKVYSEATPQYTPIKPNGMNVKLLAIFIGLALPAVFIFGAEILNDKVTTRNDIERITRAPILGEVGHSFGDDALVVTANNRKVVAEQFRILRSNLQYTLNHIQKPVIMVTSSFSGEGKSFISTNMGAVMALSGKRTIVLDFDIRKPKVLSHLKMAKKPGLTNYLLGKIDIKDIPVPVPGNDKLFVLPCGPIPPNPSELLLDEQFVDLFNHLKQEFDVVIIDTAPVGMVSDALTLSKFADCTLYVVRQGHTFKKQIALVDELYQTQKLPKVNIVLNDVKVRAGYGYGYGNYGYGYGYGSGYFEEEDSNSGLSSGWLGWLDMKRWKAKKKRKRTTV